MSGFRRLEFAGAIGLIAAAVALPGCRPDERTDPSSEGVDEMIESYSEPVVITAVPGDVRSMERSRRAVRPIVQTRNSHSLTYDEVWKGSNIGRSPKPKPAEPMPGTVCRSVKPVPRDDDTFAGTHWFHQLTVDYFENSAGFGFARMVPTTNDRGVGVADPAIDRVELVSLLTEDNPSVYVLDEMATPPLARRAKRRPLDQFEQFGLEAVRGGEHLVWTPEAPKRMFGAIRAGASCLECHSNAKKGDLLGAFTYYLTTPVDKLAERDRK